VAKFLTADHPEHGRLWAAIDPDAHHLSSRVAQRRFVAFMSPFRNEAEAAQALLAAGGVLQPTPSPRKRGAA
jgi:hypothetical protein